MAGSFTLAEADTVLSVVVFNVSGRRWVKGWLVPFGYCQYASYDGIGCFTLPAAQLGTRVALE